MIVHQKYTADEIAALQTVYEQAIYEVYNGEETIPLHIGSCCPRLDELIVQESPHNCNYWALVTAHNPRSQSLSTNENQERHYRLVKHLQELKLPYLPGVGKDASGIWTPEASLCILGIELNQAISIGERFNQNAIVYGELNRPIRLQWL
ncbi:MAG: DUF3293 domain-containing protein [Cyanobacteria bacterium J06600_6]